MTRPARLGTAAGLLLVVAFLGLLVHPALAPPSLWFDDSWVAISARLTGWSQNWETVITTPGWSVLLDAWFALVGFSELRAQVPALLAAVAIAPAGLWAGRRAWSQGPAPWVVAVLATISPLVVTYGPRVKQYSLDVLLTAVILALGLSAARNLASQGPRWRLTGMAAAAIALSASVAVFSSIVVGTVGLLAAATCPEGPSTRQRARRLAPAAALGTAAALWYALVLASTVPSGMRRYWEPWYLEGSPSAVLDQTVHGLSVTLRHMTALPVLVGGGLVLAGISVLAVRVVGHLKDARVSTQDRAVDLLLLAVTVVPWVASWLLGFLELAPWGGGRTDSPLVVPTVIAIAALVAAFARQQDERATRGRRRRPVALVAAIAVIAWSAVASDQAQYPDDDVQAVLGALGADDETPLLVTPGARHQYVLYADAEVSVRPWDQTAVGYTPMVADPRVHLLGIEPTAPDALATGEEVRDAVGEACMTWLLSSPPMCGLCVDLPEWERNLQVTHESLRSLGMQRDRATTRGRFTLARWSRC